MKIIIVYIVVSISYLYSFEVNTHQAITRCALTQECSESGGIPNLENFVKNVELNNTKSIYKDEIFDKYDKKYQFYLENEKDTGFQDWNITITPNYLGMIEAGVVLEDSLYHNAMLHGVPGKFNESLHAGDGRFNNHFYAVQFNSRGYCRVYSSVMPTILAKMFGMHDGDNLADYMKTEKTLCLGLKHRTDNIDWVFNEDVDLGEGRVNEYGLEDAFKYMKKSFEGNETERRKYQAKFFVSLGMMSHMLQDLHSPAHVRDGAHALGDYLEIYGRYDKGFNLRQGNMNPSNEPEITNAISNFDMPSYLSGMHFKSLEDIYYKEASWVSNNFFSEEHNSLETGHTQTGAGIAINNKSDRDTIFDFYNDHLSRSETHTEEAPNQWNYIKTDGTVGDVYGDIVAGYDTVAMEDEGILFGLGRNEHMLKPTQYHIVRNALNEPIELEPSDPVNTYYKADITALKHTAINVIPRAVASTQAMLNFFFRGQIKASNIYGRSLWIINASDVSQATEYNLLRFLAGAEIYIYYMNDDNISKPIGVDENGEANPYILDEDLSVGVQHRIDLNMIEDSATDDDIFEGKEIDGETRWIVVYEGDIGEDLGGSNSFGYGMKAMSVDIARDRFRRGDDNETVIDYAELAQWEDTDITWQSSWSLAGRYCTDLVLGGYDDWRLPSFNELLSILKPNTIPYIYRKYFKNLKGLGYWSSDFHYDPVYGDTATVLNYGQAFAGQVDVNYPDVHTRCIRNYF